MNLLVRNILIFVVFLLAQVLLFNNFTILNTATPHVYLLFLLFLPLSLEFHWILLIAFAAGLLVDSLSVSLLSGIHAFSCVLMMSLRRFWVDIISNKSAYRENEEAFLYNQPVSWYVQYLLPLILVHQISYYLLDAFGFDNMGITLLKIGTSTLYTFAFVLVFNLLIYKTNRR